MAAGRKRWRATALQDAGAFAKACGVAGVLWVHHTEIGTNEFSMRILLSSILEKGIS